MSGRIAGFVLAGGRSSRMGTDKASLSFEGESLLNRAVSVLQGLADPVVVVGDPRIHKLGPALVISDRICDAGPLGGIEAALAFTATPWNLIVACDMPRLDAGVLELLRNRALETPECDAVVPVCGGRPEPLCAAYHRRILPTVRAALAAGRWKIMEALGLSRIANVEIAVPASFRNVNTPEEWRAFVAQSPS